MSVCHKQMGEAGLNLYKKKQTYISRPIQIRGIRSFEGNQFLVSHIAHTSHRPKFHYLFDRNQ